MKTMNKMMLTIALALALVAPCAQAFQKEYEAYESNLKKVQSIEQLNEINNQEKTAMEQKIREATDETTKANLRAAQAHKELLYNQAKTALEKGRGAQFKREEGMTIVSAPSEIKRKNAAAEEDAKLEAEKRALLEKQQGGKKTFFGRKKPGAPISGEPQAEQTQAEIDAQNKAADNLGNEAGKTNALVKAMQEHPVQAALIAIVGAGAAGGGLGAEIQHLEDSKDTADAVATQQAADALANYNQTLLNLETDSNAALASCQSLSDADTKELDDAMTAVAQAQKVEPVSGMGVSTPATDAARANLKTVIDTILATCPKVTDGDLKKIDDDLAAAQKASLTAQAAAKAATKSAASSKLSACIAQHCAGKTGRVGTICINTKCKGKKAPAKKKTTKKPAKKKTTKKAQHSKAKKVTGVRSSR